MRKTRLAAGDEAGIQRLFLSSRPEIRYYLKPENMQVTGAYKIRGAYYKISTLTRGGAK